MRGCKNNFLLIIFLIVAMSLSIISFVSSNSGGYSLGGPPITESGTIYYSADDSGVPNAKITVICEDNNNVRRDIRETITSNEDGTYGVVFNYARKCDENDFVNVIVKKDNLNGMNAGRVMAYSAEPIDVVLMNGPPVVPEFGALVGVLTIFGAVAVFFVVRRSK